MNIKVIAKNKKAYYDYFIFDKYEAGIVLLGSEVKSIREGRVNLKDSYISIRKKNAIVNGLHINSYSHTGYNGHDPDRSKVLLLNKKEMLTLGQKISEKGLTLIPVRLYFKGSWIKLEIALAKGKKQYDKRETIKKKELKREINRQMRNKI
tara:strand:+ start:34 stop:486 length:453 start_codon:yes stop_codon:yes gene_type:complete